MTHRRILKTILLGLHLFAGLFVGLIAHASARPEPIARRWFRGLLWILSVRVTVRGAPCAEHVLLAGNHISWLDIPVLAATKGAIFVSKAEVDRWPVAGWLARGGDTLYIERGANGTQQLNQQVHAMLDTGRSVVIFPEGTTSRGHSLRRFQPRLFAGAIEAGCQVQGFALRYAQDTVPYVDRDSMGDSLWKIMGERSVDVELHFSPLMAATDDRKAIAREVESWVSTTLDIPVQQKTRRPDTVPKREPGVRATG